MRKLLISLVLFAPLFSFGFNECSYIFSNVSTSSYRLAHEFQFVTQAYVGRRTREKTKAHDALSQFIERMEQLQLEVYHYKQAKATDLKEHVKENNEIIQTLKRILDDAGEQSKIISRTLEVQDSKVSYFVLDLGEINQHSSLGLKYLSKVANRLNVQTLQIDFLGSFVRGSGGSFQSGDQILTLSRHSTLMLFSVDAADFIISHELSHANHTNRRTQGIDSPFHTQYLAFGKATLSKQGIYDKYISSEEMYTYANNMYWATDTLLKFLTHTKEEILHKFNVLANLNEQLRDISKQFSDLTDLSIPHLKKLSKSRVLLMNKDWGEIRFNELVITTIIGSQKDGIFLADYIVEKDVFNQLKKRYSYFSEHYELETANGLEAVYNNPNSKKDLYAAVKLEKDLINFQQRFFKRLLKKQQIVDRLSKGYLKTPETTLEVLKEHYRTFEEYAEIENPTRAQQNHMRESFLELKQYLKKLSMPARKAYHTSKI